MQLDPDVEKTFFGGFAPQTVGGALTFLLGRAIVKSPKLVAMVISGTTTGGRIYDEAKKVGASESDARR